MPLPKKAPINYIKCDRVPIAYADVIKVPAGKTVTELVDFLEGDGSFGRRVIKPFEIVLDDNDDDE